MRPGRSVLLSLSIALALVVAGPGGALPAGAPPDAPVLGFPSNGAKNVPTETTLEVLVSDPDGDPLTATFYARRTDLSAPEFTLVALPDTQGYSWMYPSLFTAQTQWIVDNRAALDIRFVTHLGDIVQHADGLEEEWINAENALGLLDGVVPYGLAIGTHDISWNGASVFFDLHFPASRYAGFPWYGGHYGNNRNSYQLFSVGALDFIILHLENEVPAGVLSWADGILKSFPGRRAIVTTHAYLDPNGMRPTSVYSRPDGTSAEEIWQRLIAPNCNVFLVLNGHYRGEARLTSTNVCGEPVHQILQNYQGRPNGGDGWLRYFTFRPPRNRIEARTYSPALDSFEDDADSEFVLNYRMKPMPFQEIAVRAGVSSGSILSIPWSGRSPSAEYKWYVAVSDGSSSTSGPEWTFTTAASCPSPAAADTACDGGDEDCDGAADEDYVPAPTTCGTGACAGNTGRLLCEAGGMVDTCNPIEGATPDGDCDGVDDDCDGLTDEEYVPPVTHCGEGACAAAGISTCVDGAVIDTCSPGTPEPGDSSCDGIDEDCDGTADEEYVPPQTACGVGACAGNSGRLLCVLGKTHDTCDPMRGAVPEICDGADNDCDGGADNGDPGGGLECGAGDPAVCLKAVTECFEGAMRCVSRVGPAPEVAPDLGFADSETLFWPAASGASSYSLYRGSCGGGAWVFNHACLATLLEEPVAADADAPPPSAAFYYLVAGRNACGEGTLGKTTATQERPGGASCP